MEDPNSYLRNEYPGHPVEGLPSFVVPWKNHERFLLSIDGHGMGTLECWMRADERVHAIFHALLSNGLDPWVAADLFCLTYCAPPGTYRVELSPDDDAEDYGCAVYDSNAPVLEICNVETCPKLSCFRHPSHALRAVPSDAETPKGAFCFKVHKTVSSSDCQACATSVDCDAGRYFSSNLDGINDHPRADARPDDEG